MVDLPTPFGGRGGGELFDDYDEFVPDHLPAPGPFLRDHHVLAGDDHCAFHRLTRALFEERTVYDMTFDYNLARLNLDTRHPGAGYRYAEQRDDRSVLRAEFTPTTPFCPQTHTLTVGSFRAWNGLADRHGYDIVRVRAAPMHHRGDSINEELAAMEERYRETGEVGAGSEAAAGEGAASDEAAAGDGGTAGGGTADIGAGPMERSRRAEREHRGGDSPF